MDISSECWLWSNFSSEFLDLENTEMSLWFGVCMWTGIKVHTCINICKEFSHDSWCY
jgi:hypothetical protein